MSAISEMLAAIKENTQTINEFCDTLIETKISKTVVSELPSKSVLYDFSDGVSRFTNQANTTIAVVDGVETITTITNSSVAKRAYFDFSAITSGAKTITIEYDAQIDLDTRFGISLVDMSKRPTTYKSAGIDTTGSAFWHGTKDGKIYYINGNYSSTWGAFFGNMAHTKLVIDVTAQTLSYTITTSDGITIASSTGVSFVGNAENVTGIEIYSWLGDKTAYIDNISINAVFEIVDNTLYMIPNATGGKDCYIYVDNTPVLVGSTGNTMTYSETPVKVGTWVDGTPIWRVAFPYSLMSSDSRLSKIENPPQVYTGMEKIFDGLVNDINSILVTNFNILFYNENKYMMNQPPLIHNGQIFFVENSEEDYSDLITNNYGYWGGYIEFATPETNIKTTAAASETSVEEEITEE